MNEDKKEGLTPLSDILGGLFAPDMLPHEAKEKANKPKKIKQPSSKLQAAAAEIVARPDATEAAYLARELVQCTLPHRDPGDVPVWVRRNGNYTLGLQPGVDLKTQKSIGLPYGSIPRLILLWIVTEAVRTGSRQINLGKTLNKFLRNIGLDPHTGGGKRSDAKRLKEQMNKLLNCRISFEYSEGTEKKGYAGRLNMEVAKKIQYWWDFNNPEQGDLFESQITLGEDFFNAIIASPIPVDMRALISLKQSPLAIDLYTWVTYRVYTMSKAGNADIRIPLAELKEQFGSEYTRLRDFKSAFVEGLEKVREVFPALSYSLDDNTLVLRNNKQRPAIAPTDKTAAQRRLEELRPYDQVNEKTREWFKQEYPRWDADAAIADFYSWRAEKGIVSGNTDSHFKSFAKKWLKQNQ